MADRDEQPHQPTIRDVAARAGVALSSVSRVLTKHPDVSPRMREKVEAAAKELGYEPDMLAQSMRTGSTQTVGFVLRDISNPLFANIARRCEQELRANGYSMLITSSDGDEKVEARNLSLLRRRRVDGIICSLVSEDSDDTRAALSSTRTPVVLIDREVRGLAAGAVVCDHYAGVRQATRELLSRGHRRVALVSGTMSVRSTRERLRGYEAAHQEAGVPVNPRYLALGGFDQAFAKTEVQRLLSGVEPPTALLTGGISSTAGALQAMRQLRLVVGEDVAVVVLDEWPLFDMLAPGFSSVSRDSDEMGTAAARLLLDMLHGEPARTITIDTVFTPRESLGGFQDDRSRVS